MDEFGDRHDPAARHELSGLAARPSFSRGRLHPEHESGTNGPRDIFQRDRDRIIHSVAFRRLRHKTQVFVAPDGDYFRVRLTHSIEVAQIGRTIARALGLNEDLTEALCLAHDLGHPPFGHGGEHALDAALADAGGFDHNAHTVRIVTRLETPYVGFDGLNLSWEAVEGLAKHNGPVHQPAWAMAEANGQRDLELGSWPSLEAQVASLADDIAYDNHDIDDGLRAGILEVDELVEVPIVARHWHPIAERHPGIAADKRLRALVRDLISSMVADVLVETRKHVRESGAKTIDAVRSAGGSLAGFSDALAAEERELKCFLYERLYGSPELETVRREAERVVTNLAQAYRQDSSLMPSDWQSAEDEEGRLRTIGDFIAGMTDRFAIARHEQLIGPVDLPADRF